MIIQKPIGDALFYPSDPETLQSEVTQTIEKARSAQKSRSENRNQRTALPLAAISPHAAYREVSTIMGNIYAELHRTDPKHIVIIAPIHGEILHEDAGYTIFYPEAGAFSLPGFTIPIDQAALEKINLMSESTAMRTSYFEEEPAIELQLPYIRDLFGEHPVIPLLVGNPSSRTARELAKILRTFPPEETLFIVSTNLTGDLASERAKTDAETAVEILTGRSKTPLLEALRKKHISMCGAHLLEALKKTDYFTGEWSITGYHNTDLELTQRSTYSLSALLSPKHTKEREAHD